ncbi:hypothetical protein [Alkalihalobacillus sp. 1P02AB]|uniref:hypothetical protein n=1 Tax=Alkalihalobacillus sp. 1P02AB TaxID=3132260 RepID=UPI0039A5696D
MKIGILTAIHTKPYIEKALLDLDTNATFHYYTYNKLNESKELYLTNQHQVDGWVFGGHIPQLYLQRTVETLTQPTVHVDLTEVDFYKELLSCSLKPNFDMSRTVIDFLSGFNNYMSLRSVVPENQFPIYYSDAIFDSLLDNFYETLIDFHIKAHQNGANLSITRMSNVVDTLRALGIPTIFFGPSKSSIHEQVLDLIQQLETQNLMDKQIAIGHLTFKAHSHQAKFEIAKLTLHHALLSYTEKEGEAILIHDNQTNFELITSYGDLERITNQFQICALSSYLQQQAPTISFQLGWGAGKTLHEARTNAETANRQQKQQGSPYVLTEHELIGPLDKHEEVQHIPLSLQGLEAWSEKTGVSILHLQKISTIPAKTKRHELTSDDLSLHLGITTRSANRILKKLEAGAAVKVASNKQEKLRGRPRKVYHLTFI